ncbi:MAG: hypothetical protein ACLFSM_01110 [Thermoplasmata archaeon]
MDRYFLPSKDQAGNEVQVEEEMNGAIDTVLDALGQVWDAIVEVLSEVAEAAEEREDLKLYDVDEVVSLLSKEGRRRT